MKFSTQLLSKKVAQPIYFKKLIFKMYSDLKAILLVAGECIFRRENCEMLNFAVFSLKSRILQLTMKLLFS